MITHNDFNYLITIVHTYCFPALDRGGFVTISTNLSTVPWCPLQQNNILLNIASVTQSSNTAAHTLLVSTSLSPIWRGFAPGFANYKKGALDSQSQVIKLTSCLPLVGGSLRLLQLLRLLPPLKLVAMI